MTEWFAIGLGGNMGSFAEISDRLARVVLGLGEVFDVSFRASRQYFSAPLGPVREQPPFVNQVIASPRLPDLAPTLVMAVLLDIERAVGRERRVVLEKGPRILDLDLLLWGRAQIAEPGPPAVQVPHPRMHKRRFVLAPLMEIVGEDLVVPGRLRLAEHAAAPCVCAQSLRLAKSDGRSL